MTMSLTVASPSAATHYPKQIELDFQQLTVFRYLYVAYSSALNLARGPVDVGNLPPLHIRAERVATASLPVVKPHYFEPLSDDDWQSSGLELVTPESGRHDPRDLAFCHALSLNRAVEHCLEDTPCGEGLGFDYTSDWTYYPYPEYESRVGTHEYDDGVSTYEWRITQLWARRDLSVPHLSILSAHGHVADDDRLLRSEIVAVTRMMMVWLKVDPAKGNRVCPIQMFSACGTRLRIIHGFFDGEQVVLRFTPFIDFSPAAGARRDKFLLLVRHLVGHAVGDATTLPKPLKLLGPRPALETAWKREASKYNKALKAQKKKLAEQEREKQRLKEKRSLMEESKPKMNGALNGVAKGGGTEARITGQANGSINGAPKGGSLKRPVV